LTASVMRLLAMKFYSLFMIASRPDGRPECAPANGQRKKPSPTGSRTPVFWLRTRCPGPLDDGAVGYRTSNADGPHRQGISVSGGDDGRQSPGTRADFPLCTRVRRGEALRVRGPDAAVHGPGLRQVAAARAQLLQPLRHRQHPALERPDGRV